MINQLSSQLPRSAGQELGLTSSGSARPDSERATTATTSVASTNAPVGQERSGDVTTADQRVAGSEATTNLASERAQEQAELVQVRELAQRDREVKAHERAHAAIGGEHTSAPSYTYQKGPDGRLYAVDGEVRIDTSPVANDPQATLEKAETIMRAALSVSEPSDADRRVAAEARSMAAEARAEIAKANQEAELARAEEATQAREDEQSSTDQTEQAKENTQQSDQLRQENKRRTQESLEAFNERLNAINETMRQVNQRLIDAGVAEKLFPEGSVIDRNV
ncbi:MULTISPECIES: putative metalloprotease CJM1_0395 family protein [Neptunomonas]|uniref:Catalase n=1 Tax=Neptunomonas marina TaxID=1815562 RepID=A0A437Q7C0_9GAMM|nr:MULTISPECIES: putative metalloprotease CJM1_0395 family protein [Neptunomonas]RVU30376.1 hypothetical protein EOE65_12090 [Neptunomonas marina]